MKRSHLTSKAQNIALMLQHGFRVPSAFYLEKSHELETELESLLNRHPSKTWIVRSSFGVEDGFESAFAGCFSSQVVESPTVEKLQAAILKVSQSILTPAAQEQILATGQNPERCRVGVIVQEFIAGEISGVAFSKDPQNPEEGFTEWAQGGCAPLTDGETTPNRSSFQEHPPAVLKPFWRELRRGMQRLEKMLGTPVDVEWTYDGRNLWWLQCRPMTGESIVRLKKSQGKTKWSRDKIAERFPDVMTPMGWSMIEGTLEHSMRSLVDYTGLRCRNVERASLFERGLAHSNESYFRYPNCAFKVTSLLAIVAKMLLALFVCGIPFRNRWRWVCRVAYRAFLKDASARVLKVWHGELDGHVTAIRNFNPRIENIDQARSKINEIRSLSFAFFKTDLTIHCLKEANAFLITRAAHLSSDDIARFAQNETLMMHVSLQTLCDALRTDKGADAFIKALNAGEAAPERCLGADTREYYIAFLEHCGHMSEGWDVTSCALRENSAAIAGLIDMAMKRDVKPMRDSNLALEKRLPGDLQNMFAQTQALCAADEQQHFYAGLYLEKSRQLLASIGKLLREKGFVECVEDLYYLTAAELEKYLERPDFTLIPFVNRKRKIWSRYAQVSVPQTSSATALSGLAVSDGIAQGPCYFADTFGDLAKMPENAVLCLKTPNPSFVPWFNLCSAIVTENGGALSHGFIAARELQIPAVTGIPLSELRMYERVIVDGSKGVVLTI